MSADAPESTGTLLYGFGVNLTIFASKTVLGVLTGSAAMLAEAAHSFVDMFSEVFLLTGVWHGRRRPSARYFWGLLACVNVFLAGGCYAAYEGLRTIAGAEVADSLGWVSVAVLAGSACLEASSLRAALREIGGLRQLRTTPNLAVKTMAYEDLADVLGCVLGVVGIGLRLVTGSDAWDGVASVAIGVLLAAVAVELGNQNVRLLSSAAA